MIQYRMAFANIVLKEENVFTHFITMKKNDLGKHYGKR